MKPYLTFSVWDKPWRIYKKCDHCSVALWNKLEMAGRTTSKPNNKYHHREQQQQQQQ